MATDPKLPAEKLTGADWIASAEAFHQRLARIRKDLGTVPLSAFNAGSDLAILMRLNASTARGQSLVEAGCTGFFSFTNEELNQIERKIAGYRKNLEA